MTHPPNKRRTGKETVDRVYRSQGLPPPGEGSTTRRSPLGRRLAALRRRHAGKQTGPEPDDEGSESHSGGGDGSGDRKGSSGAEEDSA